MKTRYLCANHRQQLKDNPHQAINCWFTTHENGQTLADMGHFFEALPHFGCAFETAEIVLSHTLLDRYDAVHLLTQSTASLARTLYKINQHDEADNVLQLCRMRLQQEQAANPHYSGFIQSQLATLIHFIQDPYVAKDPVASELHYKLNAANLQEHSATIH